MTLTAAEQYLLELINRGRLDPSGEAARMGINLNADLAPGQISTAPKQVLAPNSMLEAAATAHTQWMLSADVFSHTGSGGSSVGGRITGQGYSWWTYGENIAYVGTSGSISVEGAIEQLNQNLFRSAGHRENLLNDNFREIGLGAEVGQFTSDGRTWNAAMLTEDFATSGPAHFLTGVAYTDSNANKFYSMGEGTANVTFAALGQTTQTAAAGGYALALGSQSAVEVTGQSGAQSFSATIDMSPGNVKLDLVSGVTFYTSGTIKLGLGVNNALLLGVGALDASGNMAANVLTGNAGGNLLVGLAGNDHLLGGAGKDRLAGGSGNDTLAGGTGAGDTLKGGGGADEFVLSNGDGSDRIAGFSIAAGDHLLLDDALWSGQTLAAGQVISQYASATSGHVVLNFVDGDAIHLLGITELTGLAGAIEIF